MTRIFIDGREGTTGLRIQERLEGREDIELILLEEARRKDAGARKEAINSADIVFLCLPDAAAREALAMIEGEHVRVIDASTAHRTQPGWAYGFPELSAAHKAAVAQGRYVAVPGCHASGFVALVYPLIKNGVISKDMPLTCFSLTGYSGGGKKMIAEYEAPDRPPALSSPRQYGLSQAHKHLPEMATVCMLANPPYFAPIVADFYSGMEVTIPLHFQGHAGALARVQEIYEQAYAGKPMIHVIPQPLKEDMLAANALAGRDDMEILVAGNDARISLIARFDNLGKGASGAAVQCMNLMMGALETKGLTIAGG